MAYFKELEQLLLEKREQAIDKLPPEQRDKLNNVGCALYAFDAMCHGELPLQIYDHFYENGRGEETARGIINIAKAVYNIGGSVNIRSSRKLSWISEPTSEKLSRREAEKMVERLKNGSLGVLMISQLHDNIGHVSCLISQCSKIGSAKKLIHASSLKKGNQLLTPRQATKLIRREQVNGLIIEVALR